MTLPEAVNLAVRAEVRKQGVSQRWIAAQIGLSQAQIWERLTGVVDWRTSELEKLAAAMSVPVAVFLPSPERAA